MDEGSTVGTFVFPPLGHLFYTYLYICVCSKASMLLGIPDWLGSFVTVSCEES